jgi:hypothetical protein
MTSRTWRAFVMSAVGSASKTTRSARLPGSTEPITVSSAIALAAMIVADANTSAADIPARCISYISL